MGNRRAAQVALVLVVFATIGCDRVTKHAATTMLAGGSSQSYLADTVRLGYAENTGGFLGLGADLPQPVRTVVFTGGAGLMLLGVGIFAFRQTWSAMPALGLTLFLAGSASNWIDRLMAGTVVDFLNVGVGSLRTGIFNVADVAIMLGAGLFVFAEMRRR